MIDLRFFPILLIGLVTITGCKKDSDDPDQSLEFSFDTPDAVIFEHSGTQPLLVDVQGDASKQFVVRLSELNSAFFSGFSQQIDVTGGETATFDVPFNQHNTSPGEYHAKLEVSMANENVPSKTKMITLVYSPNCGWEFRNHVNGEITFDINGILENKTIACGYNNTGQLDVTGLTTYTVTLIFDCDEKTVSMVPVTNIGSYMTAHGQIEANEILLEIFSDGNSHATARIKP